jgi:hypothetical protein
MNIIYMSMYTVTPAYGITSFKQSPVLKGHLFPVIENFIWIKPLLRGHLSWKTKRWHLDTGLAVNAFRNYESIVSYCACGDAKGLIC